MQLRDRPAIFRYAFAAAITLVTVMIRLGLEPVLGGRAAFTPFIVPVLASALWCGLGPAIGAILLSLAFGAYFATGLAADEVLDIAVFVLTAAGIAVLTRAIS